jgi:hypothetical protein
MPIRSPIQLVSEPFSRDTAARVWSWPGTSSLWISGAIPLFPPTCLHGVDIEKFIFFLFTFSTVKKKKKKLKYVILLLSDKRSFCSLRERLGAKQILRIPVVCTLLHLLHSPIMTDIFCGWVLRFSLHCNWCQLSGTWYCDAGGSPLSAFQENTFTSRSYSRPETSNTRQRKPKNPSQDP